MIPNVSSLSNENRFLTLPIECVSNLKSNLESALAKIASRWSAERSLNPKDGSEHDNVISNSSLKMRKVDATNSSSFSINSNSPLIASWSKCLIA